MTFLCRALKKSTKNYYRTVSKAKVVEVTHHHAALVLFQVILLMKEILHQLTGSFSNYLQVLYIPGGAGLFPSTVLVATNGLVVE